MSVQRGVMTSQAIPMSGRKFLVAGSPPPCFLDRWGDWQCGHEHDDPDPAPLQDVYQRVGGWTAQGLTTEEERGVPIENT